MAEGRPDPDALLRAVQSAGAAHPGRGRLKVFFGANPGVGKTYAMLQEGQVELRAGRDVLAGVIETHGRAETAALLAGLPSLPLQELEHRGVRLKEFDLDAALQRQPALILIDELAHTNAPGSRHSKRWQDVEELLRAGVDVFTTLNVQHLESLNDVIAQISGIVVRETLPDSILESAAEIELVDVSPEELLQRLKDGKVYVREQAERALTSFFSKANITALRELALRKTAQQVDVQLQAERTLAHSDRTWPAGERIIVCIGPGPLAAGLVRTARRLASETHGEWEAVFIETTAAHNLPEAAKARIQGTLQLAEQLGGRATTLDGERVADTLVNYARQRNATKILVGKPTHPQWLDRLRGSLVDALIRQSGDIDVYVVRTPPSKPDVRQEPGASALQARQGKPWDYLYAVGLIALCTGLAVSVRSILDPANLAALYLLMVALVATRASRGATIVAAMLAVASFDFFCIPPYLTLGVHDVQFVMTFAVMLLIGLLIADLAYRLRQQAAYASARERQTASLYQLSRELGSQHGVPAIVACAEKGIADICTCRAVILLGRAAAGGTAALAEFANFSNPSHEAAVARWVLANGKAAGLSTATLAGAEALHLPLGTVESPTAVLTVRPASDTTADRASLLQARQRQLIDACAALVSIALERELRYEAEQAAQARAEHEQLRSLLLSSISHDLRTPLAGITGSAETLLHLPLEQLRANGQPLLQGIRDEGRRLSLLVENILDLTKLETGGLDLRIGPQAMEELVGAALESLASRVNQRQIELTIPADLPLVQADPVLIERVLVNLLDNALKYTPATSSLEITCGVEQSLVQVSVADRGPGLEKDLGGVTSLADESSAAKRQGLGLGLLICKAIVEAHGGQLATAQRPGGGAIFSFTLPLSRWEVHAANLGEDGQSGEAA